MEERAAAYARPKDKGHEPRHRYDQADPAYAAAAPLDLLLTDIAVGTSQVQPSRRNRGFADPG
jgi:hypothetical protein